MVKESRKFDIRTIDRLVREGIVSDEEYENHLASLPDSTEKSQPVESEFIHGILQPTLAEETEES